jgi:hypothetical protein
VPGGAERDALLGLAGVGALGVVLSAELVGVDEQVVGRGFASEGVGHNGRTISHAGEIFARKMKKAALAFSGGLGGNVGLVPPRAAA